MYHSSGGLRPPPPPPCKVSQTSLCTCFRTGSWSPAPLMVTGQPLLIDWEIHPSISVRMKISLVSWIVSTETDPKAGRESWNLSLVFAPADKGHFEPIKEASLKHLTFLLALGSGKRRSEIHAWQNRNIRHQSDWSRCPCTRHPAFSPRISWPKRVQTVWPQGYNSPGPQPWIDPSSLTGPSVQSEHCATIWTGPQAE